MSDNDPLAHARTKTAELHQPEVRRRRRLSPIWILPVVAVIVAAWLAYVTFAEKGPIITISLKTASGIEAGKTQIKYHDIELGVVQRVEAAPDLSHVVISAQMNKTAEDHLKEGTHFWVVRPRLSLTSLSGLETLVSGNYIEMDPGPGPAAERRFTGLEQPPVVRSDEPGTSYVVTTEKLGSISSGSPVFSRGIVVGEVIDYKFDGAQPRIPVRLFVKKPYDALVHDGTQFWNASGISVDAGAGGLKVQIESLEAVLAGGIAFETPEAAVLGEPAKADTTFPLYDNRAAAIDASYTQRVRAIVEFEGSVRGLEIGAPVEAQGIPIGRVVDFHLVVDAASSKVRVPVVIEADIARIGIINQPPDQTGKGVLARQLVALGMRAQLRTSSLITGSLIVALDFFPDAPPAEIVETSTYPKIPTVPTQMESLTRSVSQTLDKLSALPLGEVMDGVRQTLDTAQQLMRDANTRSGPLLVSLNKTSEAAETVLKGFSTTYGRDSSIPGDVGALLRQLQDTAKSVKTLASYLEEHPNSVLRGKAPPR
jgi:paraquat-inducible protein B